MLFIKAIVNFSVLSRFSCSAFVRHHQGPRSLTITRDFHKKAAAMPLTRSGKNTYVSVSPNKLTNKSPRAIDFSAFAHKPSQDGEKLTETEPSSPTIKKSRGRPRKKTAPTDQVKTPRKTRAQKNDQDVQSVSTPQKRKKTRKSATSSRTSSSRKRQRITPGSLDPPKNWEKIYSIVEELRKDRTAPLDSDGGEALPEKHLGEKVYRFQVLIALMLSSQTKDAVVGDTMRALQKHGLSPENIHKTDAEVLNSLINKVGFHNNKTKYIKQTVEKLVNEFDGDIPPTAEEMIKLPGIGPKMAYIIENVAFGVSTGIGVDTHMHRIFNDLKWVTSKTPEQTREQLEGWLPKEKWSEINMLWVGFGQESQQQKEKILKKALASSKPVEALGLLKKVGLDINKEAKKYGLEEEIKKAYNK